MKREDIILTVGGSLAAIGVAYLIYRVQQRQSALAEQNAQSNSDAIESQLANQQAEFASLPQISVPSISSTPSTTDVNQQSTGSSASDNVLSELIASFQATDNTGVTSTISPIASLNIGQILSPVYSSAPITILDPATPVGTAPTQSITAISTLDNNPTVTAANNDSTVTAGFSGSITPKLPTRVLETE